MAENTTVNKVVINNETVIDITDTTATPGTVANGQVFYKASGERAVGSMVETDPIFTASPAYGIASSDITNWDSKVGEDVSGQTFTVDETEVTAGTGAERFNDYTNNIATGANSHAEGSQTQATGVSSHAEGYKTKATGLASHAEGSGTIASSSYQHVQGKYNVEDSNGTYAHIVGNGNSSTRANIHTVDWNGAAWYKGGVKVGGTSAADATELTPGIQKFTITVTSTTSGSETTYTANKTFAEIVAAYNNGDILEVIISGTESILTLSNADASEYGIFTFERPAVGDGWAASDTISIDYEDNVSYYYSTFSETDPTVPSWAKQPTKPTYTASEVGALPDTTTYVSSFNGSTGDVTFSAPVTSVNGATGAVKATYYVTLTYNSGSSTFTASATSSEVYAAYEAGYDVYALYSNFRWRLVAVSSSAFTFSREIAKSIRMITWNRSTETITADTYYTFQTTDNKVTSISSASTDAQYPSAKLLYDTVTNLESQIPTKTSDLTNDSGFLTSYTETDPTVPSWAKQSTKPTYTASEVGALPDTTEIPTKTSDLTNDSGFITSYTETDPTVPSWAKQSTKPTYTASEVGALPSTTVIPSKTSDLTNDSGFLTSHQPVVQTLTSGTAIGSVGGTVLYAPPSTPEIFIGSTTPSGYTMWIDPEGMLVDANEVEY